MHLIFVGQGYPRKLFNLEHFLIYGTPQSTDKPIPQGATEFTLPEEGGHVHIQSDSTIKNTKFCTGIAQPFISCGGLCLNYAAF